MSTHLSAHASSHPSPPAGGIQLRLDGVSQSFAGRRVLTDISLVVSGGERVGLIGENGSGKSTLLRIAAGIAEPDAGSVRSTAPGGLPPRIGLLHQQAPFTPEDSVEAALEAATAPARRAAADVDRRAIALSEDPSDDVAADSYALALDVAERSGAWEIDAFVGEVLDGVGLAAIPRDRATGALSGGQRARLSLAWLLLNSPDVLLLDEPTNHLDDQAVAYLEGVLNRWRGPVLFASHDRAFLDGTATSLIDLDPAPRSHATTTHLLQDGIGTGIGTVRFTGGYSDYLAEQAEERLRWEQQYRDEQDELGRLRASVAGHQSVGHSDWKPRSEVRRSKKFYADRNARVVSRRVRDARSRLAELEEQQIRKPPARLRFTGLAAGARLEYGDPRRDDPRRGRGLDGQVPGRNVVSAKGLTIAGRLGPIDLDVDEGDHWLITGPNGSGKSTLLHAIAGDLRPGGGHLLVAPGLRVGLLDQEIVLPDPHRRGPARTVRSAYSDAVGSTLAEEIPLSTFGLIAGRDENRAVSKLSVGQQRRLALAILLADPPDALLLDEPTNHLSLSLVEELEDAIEDFPGTLLIASHDRRLRSRWGGRTLTL